MNKENNIWLKVGFQINNNHHWFKGEENYYWFDLYILDTIIRDTLIKFKSKIILWRFHRRSDEDKHGHMPSFLIFINKRDLDVIKSFIYKHKEYKDLSSSKVLKKVYNWEFDGLGGQSDPKWDTELSLSWPYFGQGFSQMILKMLDEFKKKIECYYPGLKEYPKVYYTYIYKDITDTWKRWGRHAFIHHLFCIFGEEPFLIDKI